MALLKHMTRYREVAATLARHGLGFMVGGFGLDTWVGRTEAAPGSRTRAGHLTTARHLRLALEELGPTFIKVGQLLSTRSDLLPPEYIAELSKLQGEAPPVSSTIVMQAIHEELGVSAMEVFADFDETPLASASIGQAHAATLRDGTPVVVKVRRPGVVEQIQNDLEILENLAARASEHLELAADVNLVGLVDEFAGTIRAELDYVKEARNAERFAGNFRDSDIHIPRVFWSTTTSRVLTLERITGVKIDDLTALDAAGLDHSDLVRKTVDAVSQMIFVDGFFHADLHPGNLLIEPGGRLGLIDFGMVGSIDDELRERIAAFFVALAREDAERVSAALIPLTSLKKNIDRERLNRDIAHLMTLYQGRGLGELKIGALFAELMSTLRRHRLQLHPQIVMLLRTLTMVEGISARLDPAFQLDVALRPFALRLAAEQWSPRVVAARVAKAGRQLAMLGLEVPEKLSALLDSVGADGIEVHLGASEFEPMVRRLERIGNRLIAAIIASALIGGIGRLTADADSRWRGWNGRLMGAGVGALGSLGAYLALSGRRRGRPG